MDTIREDLDTIERLVSFSERRGTATQVIWNGDDSGFYTCHLVTGRHTHYAHLGQPTGRSFVSRTIANYMILRNKIYHEWLVADTMAIVRQLRLDADAYAEKIATSLLAKKLTVIDIGENRRLVGHNPPESEANTSICNTPVEAETRLWLHAFSTSGRSATSRRCMRR